jgi:hypothetical protein
MVNYLFYKNKNSLSSKIVFIYLFIFYFFFHRLGIEEMGIKKSPTLRDLNSLFLQIGLFVKEGPIIEVLLYIGGSLCHKCLLLCHIFKHCSVEI